MRKLRIVEHISLDAVHSAFRRRRFPYNDGSAPLQSPVPPATPFAVILNGVKNPDEARRARDAFAVILNAVKNPDEPRPATNPRTLWPQPTCF